MIILTGGLGPTQDDLTKEIVAEAMGVDLYFDERCYREVKSYFDDRNRIMAENNRKQAYIPVGAEVFHNEAGTAPAFGIEKDGAELALLYQQHIAQQGQTYAGASELLDNLTAADYEIYGATNGITAIQTGRMAHSDISPYLIIFYLGKDGDSEAWSFVLWKK